MKLQVYVIFHDQLTDEYYENLDQDEFDLITFIAVNENIPKVYNKNRFKNVIHEWELPIYDKNFQRHHVCDETLEPKAHITDIGVHYHIAMNRICGAEYIYTCHNDMYFYRGSIKRILDKLEPTKGITIRMENYDNLVRTSTFSLNEKPIYDTAVQLLQVQDHTSKMYPLFTNCAMNTELYYKAVPPMVDACKKLFVHCVHGPSYRLSICVERIWAIGISNVLDNIEETTGILHAHVGEALEYAMRESENGTLRQYK